MDLKRLEYILRRLSTDTFQRKVFVVYWEIGDHLMSLDTRGEHYLDECFSVIDKAWTKIVWPS